MFVCVTCIKVCRSACATFVEVTARSWVSLSLLPCPIELRIDFSWNLKLALSARLTDQSALEILLSLPSKAKLTDMNGPCLTSYEDAGVSNSCHCLQNKYSYLLSNLPGLLLRVLVGQSSMSSTAPSSPYLLWWWAEPAFISPRNGGCVIAKVSLCSILLRYPPQSKTVPRLRCIRRAIALGSVFLYLVASKIAARSLS